MNENANFTLLFRYKIVAELHPILHTYMHTDMYKLSFTGKTAFPFLGGTLFLQELLELVCLDLTRT